MEIGPVNNGKTAVNQPQSREAQDGAAEQNNRPTDDVRISGEARDRLRADKAGDESRTDQERPVKDSTDDVPEKMRLIRERIDADFYEQTFVRDHALDKLIDEMLENINQFYQ